MIYISILRGINVSAKNIIKMDALRKAYENAGFSNVQSYIQSGNIIFKNNSGQTKELAQKINQLIQENFELDIPVLVLSVRELKHIIENNPFAQQEEKDPTFFHVTFLSEKSKLHTYSEIEAKKSEDEEISFSDDAIYLYCPNGYGKTKLTNNFIESKLKVTATTRNWKTVNELMRISNQMI
jgi:uncharacterized protein (DUF1697 family)